MRTPVSSMAARSSTQLGWSQRDAAGRRTRQASTGGRAAAACQALRSAADIGGRFLAAEGAVVAVPEELRDLFQRAVAREPCRVLAAIEEASVLDQRQRRFEHGRAEVERVGGDRLGLAADVAAALELGDIVGPVAPLTLPVRALGAQQAAAHIGVERGGRDAEALRRFLRAQPFRCHFLLWINSVNIDNTYAGSNVEPVTARGFAMLQTRVDSGLDGVVVADTVMSEVDGEAGRLIVRGQAIEDLVGPGGFEGVAALLWEGFAQGGGDEPAVRQGLAAARVRAFAEVPKLLTATKGLNPVEGLRVGLGMLADSEPMPHHYLVCGALPVFLAALLRAAEGKSALAPDPSLTTAQDLLRMIRGKRADEAFEKGLDTYLATVTDHGFNASTFTARVVASTRAGLISSVLAALCALKGPLHGGAPGPVLDMFDEIGTPERAEAWLDDAFAKGTRLMGFGHRVYKMRDPAGRRAEEHGGDLAADGGPAGLRGRGRAQRHRVAAQAQARAAARHQRRVLHGAPAGGARDAAQRLHRPVRRRSRRGLVRPHLRAGEGRAADPAAIDLRRRAAAVGLRLAGPWRRARCGLAFRRRRRPRGSRRRPST